MKYVLILILLFVVSCNKNKQEQKVNINKDSSQKEYVTYPRFDTILSDANTDGSIVIYDFNENTYYSNDFEWAEVVRSPASTFKIPNSIIALETNVVDYDTTIFKWNGEKRDLAIWEQDMNLKQAFHNSCVPCYQKIARSIGFERMNKYLLKLQYGNVKIDSNNISTFWLVDDFGITQMFQIEFLVKLYKNELHVSEKTQNTIKDMMITNEIPDVTLRAKTGWAIRQGKNNGWYVGYIDKDTNAYFFATNISPNEEFDMSMFPKIRKDITFRALKAMNIIK